MLSYVQVDDDYGFLESMGIDKLSLLQLASKLLDDVEISQVLRLHGYEDNTYEASSMIWALI